MPGDNRAYAYLHGFASGPLATKGLALAERFSALGLELKRPDLNLPSFERLSVAAMLQGLDTMHADALTVSRPDPQWCLLGSSMGAWVGALWAAAHPQRVSRVLWLAPGFGLRTRWPAMLGPTAFARWEQRGVMDLPDGSGQPKPVHFELVREAEGFDPAPAPAAPTLLMHGVNDAVVPVETSRAYVSRHGAPGGAELSLVELDDDHRLLASVEEIWARCRDHFAV